MSPCFNLTTKLALQEHNTKGTSPLLPTTPKPLFKLYPITTPSAKPSPTTSFDQKKFHKPSKNAISSKQSFPNLSSPKTGKLYNLTTEYGEMAIL
jgi:hypothetical protein